MATVRASIGTRVQSRDCMPKRLTMSTRSFLPLLDPSRDVYALYLSVRRSSGRGTEKPSRITARSRIVSAGMNFTLVDFIFFEPGVFDQREVFSEFSKISTRYNDVDIFGFERVGIQPHRPPADQNKRVSLYQTTQKVPAFLGDLVAIVSRHKVSSIFLFTKVQKSLAYQSVMFQRSTKSWARVTVSPRWGSDVRIKRFGSPGLLSPMRR